MLLRRSLAVLAASVGCLLGIGTGCTGTDPVAVSVSGTTSRSITVAPNGAIDITLGTVGPGEYVSPPSISSASVRFVGMEYVGPYVPAGPRQRFRFEAVAPGQAVIVFSHTGDDPVVEDTIVVR